MCADWEPFWTLEGAREGRRSSPPTYACDRAVFVSVVLGNGIDAEAHRNTILDRCDLSEAQQDRCSNRLL